MPLTQEPQLFRHGVELGRTLIWLHTFGERFVRAGSRRGSVPQGRARCTRGVPTTPEGYPEEFSYDPAQELLRVGAGEFQSVSPEVWGFSVSGLNVLESWLNYRKKAGAGRQSSPLDRIRPAQWTAALTQELLELIWVLEATIEQFPQLSELFNAIIESPAFTAAELLQPGDEERQPPAETEEDNDQHELPM